MSEGTRTNEALVRECLDRQLSLALEQNATDVKLAIPGNSKLALGAPGKESITFEEAMLLCSSIEKKEAQNNRA